MSALEKVKELRDVTGAGMQDCKNALKENDNNIEKSIEKIFKKKFQIEERSLIKVSLEGDKQLDSQFPYALNEISVVRKDTTSMVNINTSLNGIYLNSYCSDGLIVSTPTGSTGYSLSCGGPVISPSSQSLVLTPISPHNLNARPLVISDSTKISISVSGREEYHLLSIDSKVYTVKNETKIVVNIATIEPIQVNMKSGCLFCITASVTWNALRKSLSLSFDKPGITTME